MDAFGPRGRGRKKKLTEVGEWWAALPPTDQPIDTVDEDFKILGVKGVEVPEWMREEGEPSECGVLAENWDAVEVFLACATQWNADGLRYEGLQAAVSMMQLADRQADIFWRVRVMERAALRVFATNRKG